jgi:hypothetical protein
MQTVARLLTTCNNGSKSLTQPYEAITDCQPLGWEAAPLSQLSRRGIQPWSSHRRANKGRVAAGENRVSQSFIVHADRRFWLDHHWPFSR